MIYFIVTTCLVNLPHYRPELNSELREEQYTNGITKLLDLTKEMDNVKIIIVENNGKRETFLDNFGCDVLYTNNNYPTTFINIGIKEMKDILDCIDFFKIKDDDFIVKFTGRYIIQDNSLFMNIIKTKNNDLKAIFKFTPDYIFTGLIGLQCSYVKQINYDCDHFERNSIEYQWGEVISRLDPSNVVEIKDIMGINSCTGSDTYHGIF